VANLRTPDPGVGAGIAQAANNVGTIIGAVADAVTRPVTSVAGDVAAGLGDVTDGVRAVRRWVSDRHSWVRVAYVVAGGLMFAVGVVMVSMPAVKAGSQVVAPIAGVAGKVAAL